MSLWIQSVAKEWDGDVLKTRHAVMDGAFFVSDWHDDKDDAIKKMEKIQEDRQSATFFPIKAK